MNFYIITIFPEMFDSYLNESLMARAKEKKLMKVNFLNPRDFTRDKHKKVDDRPYGGGPGMVMAAEPILLAIESIINKLKKKNKQSKVANKTKIVILSPRGKMFTNKIAKDWTKKYKNIILISGRYEGIDARVNKILKTDISFKNLVSVEEISIGDYVLTGGELPSMVLIDSIMRQTEGFLGKIESIEENRISSHEVYTRPEILKYKNKNYKVPKVLISGHHVNIEEWRKKRN